MFVKLTQMLIKTIYLKLKFYTKFRKTFTVVWNFCTIYNKFTKRNLISWMVAMIFFKKKKKNVFLVYEPILKIYFKSIFVFCLFLWQRETQKHNRIKVFLNLCGIASMPTLLTIKTYYGNKLHTKIFFEKEKRNHLMLKSKLHINNTQIITYTYRWSSWACISLCKWIAESVLVGTQQLIALLTTVRLSIELFNYRGEEDKTEVKLKR